MPCRLDYLHPVTNGETTGRFFREGRALRIDPPGPARALRAGATYFVTPIREMHKIVLSYRREVMAEASEQLLFGPCPRISCKVQGKSFFRRRRAAPPSESQCHCIIHT
jgi:hypothetical protein